MTPSKKKDRKKAVVSPSLKKRGRKFTDMVERAMNRALADGFTPYDAEHPTYQQSALVETARRLDLSPDVIIKAIKKGHVFPANNLFNADKPHESFLASMRLAGIEITSDEGARRQALRVANEVNKLRKELEKVDQDNLTTEEIRTKIFRLSALPPVIPDWVTNPRLGHGGPGIPITLWSDWHYGEVVNSSQMGRMNSYSLAIADSRIEMLVDRVCDITKNHQVSPDYPGIIVCLGGDMFSGDGLHDELTDTNEVKIMEAFTRLQGRLIWSFKRLADEFGKVHVPCAFGNHSRTTDKPRYKLRAETNYEYLLYNQLEFYFQNDSEYQDRVSFQISNEDGVHFTVGKNKKSGNTGHRYYLTHGDSLGVKGGDGIIGAIGPIKRGSIKVSHSEASIGRTFDTLVIGHWHQYLPMPGIIANGTLKGWDEYARLKLRATFDHPAQALWFNHPLYGPVAHHKIILTENACGKKAPQGCDLFPTDPPKDRLKTVADSIHHT